MITIRINLLVALATVTILISSFEIQRGVFALEQVISHYNINICNGCSTIMIKAEKISTQNNLVNMVNKESKPSSSKSSDLSNKQFKLR